ncbi:FtsW/RodA/SpoVE family cell cycle protein [Candidatus Chloroploca asiatica]|uniref:Rod shape-determining protein RodA n=1 Tax=Candidatus Chloroploca asiatica TaxID=1506545 RepID=A0A2H3L083_9CHLR|nr:FtsW/RodA/SpoVE family cell cycle protein [Candidatus Chloroploca asiatica]PDV98050.1 rod shape-determining protein RodA [Candidatus Chloroploca asiatica]
MEIRRWRQYNWPLLVCVIVLLVLGALAVYSATLTAVTGTGVPLHIIYPDHLINMGLGLTLMVAFTFFDYQLLSSLARPIYLIGVFLLILVLFIGRTSEGARSWIEIGARTFQPTELAKLALIIVLAAYWQRFEQINDRWLVQLGGLVIAGLLGLLVLVQPDLGGAIVIASIWVMMAWGSGIRWQQILTLTVIMLPLVYIGWQSDSFLDDYQKRRLLTFYYLLNDPSLVDFNDSYNVVQAMNALTQGGLFGAGLTNGLFSQGNYVPVQHTDFIFAVIGEEMGFFGGVVLITFQAFLLWQALSIANQARDTFGRLMALGIFGMLFCHLVINLGMNMSLLPVTGLPLPLVSHGGSFMIITLISIGLLQSIALRSKRLVF